MFALALLLASSPPSPASAPAPAPAAATSDDARLLGDLVAAAAAKVANVDVLTSEDVRKAVNFDADKAMLGCNEQTCLAEIANAIGAAVVLYGNVGHLAADDMIVTLSLFDGENASSGGRAVLRGASLKTLADEIAREVPPLVERGVVKRTAGGKRVRLLVLDLEQRGASSSTSSSSSSSSSSSMPLFVAGGAVAVLGAAGVVVGAIADAGAAAADAKADDTTLTQKRANDLYDERDNNALVAGIGYVAGTALVVGGAALFVWGIGE